MALTISIEGKGVIANCDALTNDTGGTGTGDWSELGGGTIDVNPDVYLYGSSCIGNQYANKSGWTYFDIGAGNELDFGTSGTEEGQFFYIWLNIQSTGQFDTLANKGFAFRFGSSTTDYREFILAGDSEGNGWFGGWKCFVLDPTKTGSVSDTGTLNLSSIRYVGIWIDADVAVRAESVFIDQIAVGTGLRVTGTSTTGWKDIVDYCTDYTNRAWGMFEEREGIYYCKGKIYIGDTTQTSNTSFADSGRTIKFETSEYYNGSAWVSALPTTAFGIVVEDAASYTTTFSDGVVVGSDNGRSGSTFIGNSNENISLDFYGGNNTGSVTALYGSTFKSIYGAITFGNDSDHKIYGCTFQDCSQVDPVGAPVIRNCIFAETADADAALLWNENINIQNCNFIANTTGAAIEHPSAAGTPYTHTNLVMSGNTYDVLNSSGSAITVTKAGTSNGSTYEGSTVTYQSSITITITVQDTDTDPIQNVQTGIYKTSDRTQIMNEDTNASGVATENYIGATPVDVEIRCRKASSGATKYKNFSTLATLSGNFDLLVTLQEDPNNNATT